jgi:glutathione S-transferase
MPKLYYAPASPYSCKVRMAAAHAGIALETVETDTNADPAELLQANPLGKIPVLVTDDSGSVHDSGAITQYLNRLSGNRLFPRNADKRTEAEKLEALADGMCDCLLAQVYERRYRPEEKVHQPWLERLWSKVVRSLDELEAEPPKLTGKLRAGQMALRCALGYMDLRFAGKWQPGRPKLKRWAKKFDQKYPGIGTAVAGLTDRSE